MRKLRQWHNQLDYQPKELKKPAFSGFFVFSNDYFIKQQER